MVLVAVICPNRGGDWRGTSGYSHKSHVRTYIYIYTYIYTHQTGIEMRTTKHIWESAIVCASNMFKK